MPCRSAALLDFQQALLSLSEGTLPDCRPVGVDYEGFKAALGIDVAASVDELDRGGDTRFLGLH